MGKVIRKITKPIRKLIPKEIKPALPYIAAFYGQPHLAKGLGSVGAFAAKNPAVTKALISGATSAVTDENANILRSAALAAAPDLISGGLGNVAQKINPNIIGDYDEIVKVGKTATRAAGALQKASEGIKGASALQTIGTQAAVDSAAKLAEIQQDEIDKYNEDLRKQGVLDKTKRRTSIFNIYQNAGYDADYINSMLDRYGYDEGGLTRGLMSGRRGRAMRGVMTMDELLQRTPLGKVEDDDEKITVKRGEKGKVKPKASDVNITFESEEKEPDFAEAMLAAKSGVEQAFGIPFGGVTPAEFKRFATGGEVEIEEETDDLGIMDLMRDQGIEYGEQVSNTQNDQILEMLFEKYLEMGLSPKDAAEAAQNEFDRMSRKSDKGIMQMASGYKTDIEEMYEQYVFEMEEQGLQPMSFREFVDQARSGMADGGIMEKDMRGGGFIPEGTKERADDVPARLSKNEFVMTADAVKAAGGGSVNKGAKRMYDMMYSLEGKV
jgi:hypothetical protein